MSLVGSEVISQRAPRAAAVVAGESTLSYAELEAHTIRIRGSAIQLGIGVGVPVAKATPVATALTAVAAALTALGAVPGNSAASAAITAAVAAINTALAAIPSTSTTVT